MKKQIPFETLISKKSKTVDLRFCDTVKSFIFFNFHGKLQNVMSQIFYYQGAKFNLFSQKLNKWKPQNLMSTQHFYYQGPK